MDGFEIVTPGPSSDPGAFAGQAAPSVASPPSTAGKKKGAPRKAGPEKPGIPASDPFD